MDLDFLQNLHRQLQTGVANAAYDYGLAQQNLEKIRATERVVSGLLMGLENSSDLQSYSAPVTSIIAPSGLMMDTTVGHYLHAPDLPQKALFAAQLQTTAFATASDFLASLPPEKLAEFVDVKSVMEHSHQKIQSLFDRVAEKLGGMKPFLRELLERIVVTLADPNNPARYQHAATDLRELIRETFEVLSPDAQIKECSWFVPDPTSKTGVTRRHRALFAIFRYLDPSKFPSKFVEEVESLAKQLVNHIGELSKYTHVTEATAVTSEIVVSACLTSTLQVILSLFETIETSHKLVCRELETDVAGNLSSVFTEEFFDELDSLSSHTRPQDAEDVAVEVDTIDKEYIYFCGSGSVLCDLQMGSDGDCRRGDGLEWSDSFPFKFRGKTSVEDWSKVEIEPGDIEVDTSSYYDNGDDKE